jgi:hypothetical protein
MAWFLNYYSCGRCGEEWRDEWSCMCDDECPHCGSRDHSPEDSEDLTEVITKEASEFVLFRSPDTAEHDPDYQVIGRFPSFESAKAFQAKYDPDELVVLSNEAPCLSGE